MKYTVHEISHYKNNAIGVTCNGKFKAGDKVRFVEKYPRFGLVPGRIYTVNEGSRPNCMGNCSIVIKEVKDDYGNLKICDDGFEPVDSQTADTLSSRRI